MTGKEIKALGGHDNTVTFGAFSPNGSRVVTASCCNSAPNNQRSGRIFESSRLATRRAARQRLRADAEIVGGEISAWCPPTSAARVECYIGFPNRRTGTTRILVAHAHGRYWPTAKCRHVGYLVAIGPVGDMPPSTLVDGRCSLDRRNS